MEGVTDPVDKLVNLIPREGWIGEYMQWTEKSEPPARFRFATAMGIISSVLSRNIWLPYENRGTYPNLWILLMGPSGCGKDSAISQGYNLFMQLEDRPKVIAEKITPEALVRALASHRKEGTVMKRDAKGVVFAPELSNFLGKVRYNEGMIQLLTRLYDCPPSMPTETIARKSVTLTDVCLTMMWGSTPDWYLKYMPDGVMCGGFMSRILYVFYVRREKRVPNPGAFCKKAEARLMSTLADMRKLKGPIKLEPSAEDFFNHWYESIPEPTKGDEHMAGYISRKPMTVKKLAMVLMISESHKLVMKQHHLELAIKVMNALEEQLMSEVGGMEASEASRATDIVATIIARKPDGMSRREVMQKAYKRIKGRREEFDRIIDWLLHLGTITQGRHPDTNEMWYKAVNG